MVSVVSNINNEDYQETIEEDDVSRRWYFSIIWRTED